MKFQASVEGLEVSTGNDVMVAAFAAPGFERTQNCLDARRRVRRPLDVEWFAVSAEHKLFSAVRRDDAAENAAPLFEIGARRKPEPSGIADRVLDQLARRLRRHSHRAPIWEEPIDKAFLVIGNTGKVVGTRIFYTQAKYVEQEKPSFNTATGFTPAHYEIAPTQIE